MIDADDERRQTPRFRMHRGCKVLNPRTGRYVAGTTCDVSDRGALVRLDRDPGVEIGDRILLGVTQRRHQSVLMAAEMTEVEVVRRMNAPSGEILLGLRSIWDRVETVRWAA